MRVLYVSHTSLVGGGEHSLLELIPSLASDVDAVAACPPGPAARAFQRLGVPVMTIPGTAGSLKFHPWRTPLALGELTAMAVNLRRVARATTPAIIHANSVRAGLAAVLSARLGGAPPPLVHVRDCLPSSPGSLLVRRVILNGSESVLANSGYTAARFAPNRKSGVYVIANSVDPSRFNPKRYSPDEMRVPLGIGENVSLVGVIAQITPWKGQDDAIRALARLRRAGSNTELLIVGEPKFASASTRLDNNAYMRSLIELARQLRVEHAVHYLGERGDIPEILGSLDLVLVPSWEEPFGRSVIEAMAMARPVIATDVGGPAEIIRDGIDGFLLPPRTPEHWAPLALELLSDVRRRTEVGQAARETVINRYNPQRIAAQMLAIYRHLTDGAV